MDTPAGVIFHTIFLSETGKPQSSILYSLHKPLKTLRFRGFLVSWTGCKAKHKGIVVLSDKLAAKASKSPIKEYLGKYYSNNNTIEVIKEVKHSRLFAELARTGRRNEAMSLMNFEEAEGYPAREKCEAIIQWLSKE